tara:strand:- start:3186 stop:4736 length:1551 start_codon:yes stop_codon:yes gene_type:complete
MVLWLNEISKSDADQVGEKAALLGEIEKFGFPTPRAFVIPFEEFNNAKAQIEDEINTALSTANPDDFNSIIYASEAIKKAFLGIEIDEALKKEIADAYNKLHINKSDYGNVRSDAFNFIKAGRDLPFVAVRVSNNSSKPKHHSALLNIKLTGEVLTTVKKAWASIYSPYSILYRIAKGAEFPRAAVIIQEMVNATKSGDVFSINPINGNPNQIVVQARWGLGLKTSPGANIYFYDKQTAEVIDSHTRNPKDYYTTDPQTGRTALRTLEMDFQNLPVMGSREIELISKISSDISKRLEMPVHLEWGIQKRKFMITQVRPATNYFKSTVTSNSFQSNLTENLGKGIPIVSGSASGKLVFLTKDKAVERGDLAVLDAFSGQFLPKLLKSGAIIFQNEDLTSFGTTVARDFDKPCTVKTEMQVSTDQQMAEINSSTGIIYGTNTNAEIQPILNESKHNDLTQVFVQIEQLEKDISNLNLKFASERQTSEPSEQDKQKAKLISELEWDLREIKDKISKHQS